MVIIMVKPQDGMSSTADRFGDAPFTPAFAILALSFPLSQARDGVCLETSP